MLLRSAGCAWPAENDLPAQGDTFRKLANCEPIICRTNIHCQKGRASLNFGDSPAAYSYIELICGREIRHFSENYLYSQPKENSGIGIFRAIILYQYGIYRDPSSKCFVLLEIYSDIHNRTTISLPILSLRGFILLYAHCESRTYRNAMI
jgi:hypothetical protein